MFVADRQTNTPMLDYHIRVGKTFLFLDFNFFPGLKVNIRFKRVNDCRFSETKFVEIANKRLRFCKDI
jgi:hypothetical protein